MKTTPLTVAGAILLVAAFLLANPTLAETPGVRAVPVKTSPSVTDYLPEVLHDPEGAEITSELLEGKYVGLYFSAHWCPPCRAFTPSLVEFRNRHAEEFEVLFISFDESGREKRSYVKEASMPWPSVPGARSRDGNALAKALRVRGYPTLVILAPDGSIVTPSGREDVTLYPETALEKWKTAKQS